MNSHQRRVSMTRRHKNWPLGTPVIVKRTIFGDISGKVSKHWRGHDYACTVTFPEIVLGLYSHRVPFKKMVKGSN